VPYKDYDTPQSAFLGQQLPESLWNFTNSPGWWAILVVIAIMYSLVSNAGDLLFSWIKRKNNIKDFSSILKGHGGLLDRLDSLTISIAIFGFITVIIAFICSYLTHNSNCIFPLFTSQ
jgi:CDP-diglyceride synthetase